jgi:hypothetical protein
MNALSDTVFNHYISNSSLVDSERGACLTGSKNLTFTGAGRAQCFRGPAIINGVTGSRLLFNAIDGSYAGLGDFNTAGIGNIIGLIARALGIIGSGEVYINGVSRSISASTALQLLLYVSASYTGTGTGPFTAGLEPPTAPTLANTPTASTIMSGTYSAVIWFVRGATGGRSRRSSPSAVIVNSGFKMRLTVAGADLTYAASVGADRIGIGVTAAGFGSTGPHYEEREIAISTLTTVDTVANSVLLEWADPQLIGKDLAPILDYPPPAGVFAAALEDVVAVIGCYGDIGTAVTSTTPGTAIAVSLPVFIESFPPDSLLFLPAPPKGVLSRAADGYVFIGGEGYVAALLYTGGANPLSLRVIWPTTGIQSPNNWFLGEGGRLYAATAKRGLVRIDSAGEPDTSFAEDVVDDTASWTMANVIGGFDADHNRDVFGHDQTLLLFNPQREKWDTPIDLSTKITGSLCSCVPVSGGLLLAANDGSTIRLYTFNSGTGMTYQAYGQIHLSEAEADQLLRVEIAVRSDTTNAITVKIFTNGDGTTAKDTRTVTPTATRQHLPTQKPNVRGAKSHQVYLSQACGTGDAGPDRVRIRGVSSNIS